MKIKDLKDKKAYRYIVKSDWRDRVTIEVGDVKDASRVFPQVKIGRWGNTEEDNECNYSVRLIDNELTIPSISVSGDKITYSKPKKELNFYNLALSNALKEGGYEFEVLLKEKPLTNKIRFTLQDKDVEYFRQHPLTEEITPEQIAKGWTATETDIRDENGRVVVHRPENVVGSYAVYAKTPKTNWKGGKLYRAGKVGHIYRPKITDNAGNWTWGELNISNGILTITINQNWLDNAVYPVVCDPTFGYDTVGGSVQNCGSDYIRTSDITNTPSDSGTVDSMSIYAKKDTDDANLQMAIYDNTALIGHTNAVLINSTEKWWTATASGTISIDNSTSYYLPLNPEYSIDVYYDSGGGYVKRNVTTYGTWPDPIDWTDTTYAQKYSIYCTYTASSTDLAPSASDSATITESITIQTSDLSLSVSDSVTVTDSPTTQESNPDINISTSDSLTIADIPEYYPDELTIGENVTVNVTTISELYIDTSDDLTITETITATNQVIPLSTSDNLAITESTQTTPLSLEVSLSDSLSLTEQITATNTPLTASVADNLTLIESLSQFLTSYISTLDSLSITELTSQVITELKPNISDDLTISESVSADITTAEININTSDQLTISESFTSNLPIETAIISIISVTEDSEVLRGGDLVSHDNLSIAESVSVANTSLFISVSDQATLTESTSLIPSLGVNKAEQLTITENTPVIASLAVSVADSATISEYTYIPSAWEISVSESVSLAESVSLLKDIGLEAVESLTIQEYNHFQSTTVWTDDSEHSTAWTDDAEHSAVWTDDSEHNVSWTEE